ncbi:MAG: redoxin [Bacteroidetes bacterium]|nr:MAG: redoxin [Bacteroidota bacterium]
MQRFSHRLVGLLILVLFFHSWAFAAGDIETLPIGSKAPDFNLPGIDGKNYSLESFKEVKILVIAFICNHCPTSQAYEERLISMASDYAARGVNVVAINPNNPASLRYDELGWSDVGDSFDDMKIRSKEKNFNFPYLYDGETQIVSRQFGPQATPHIFIFDADRILRYKGRVDDMENPHETPRSTDARNAIEALLDHKPVPVPVTKVFGCSIKWLEKKDWMNKAAIHWANEPVTLDTIGVRGVANIMKNNSDKLILINIWATDCSPCTEKFSDFITLSRIYKERDFEFISVSIDNAENFAKILTFLKKQQSSGRNYLFAGDDNHKLTGIIDPAWTGALPYTLLVEPGGKIVYSKNGIIDFKGLRKRIFDDPFIGRLYK